MFKLRNELLPFLYRIEQVFNCELPIFVAVARIVENTPGAYILKVIALGVYKS